MKRIVFSATLILTFCCFAFGQTQNNPNCPEIKVTGPSSVVQPGETMTFTIIVSDVDSDKIEYHWSVDKGAIIRGQGTPVITISTEGFNETTITATVEIKDLLNGCSNSASETGVVAPICILPLILDEFGKIPLNDQKARLALIKTELEKNTEDVVLIILYHTPKDNKTTLGNRAARVKNFLVKDNKVPEARIFIVFGGEEPEERTRIYIVPEGVLMRESYDTKKSLDEVEFSSTAKP